MGIYQCQENDTPKLLNSKTKSAKFRVAYAQMLIAPVICLTALIHQNRLLFKMHFHGTLDAARLHLRAMALI